MASAPYEDRSPAEAAPRERSPGEHIFIWIAWALAAALWGATMTTFVGILRAVAQPGPGVWGGSDAAGVAWVIIDVVGGLVLLGAAMAYGSWMFARRDRRLDPLTEARTAALYDDAERQDAGRAPSAGPSEPRSPGDFR